MVAGAVAAALLIGLLLGGTLGLFDRVIGGPKPETIASASLESMRAQSRLNVFAARYVSVTTSKVSRFGFSNERTLILPGDVRYEVDLAKLGDRDVRWDAGSKTLTVTIPDVEVAGPEVDLAKAREYGGGGIIGAIANTQPQLDQANRAAAVTDLRKQAAADTPMRLAREAARQAIARSFAMPLRAAGFEDAKVVARFPFESGTRDPSYIDQSRSYNEVLEEAARKRR
ncbi:DUF4230 domain-containing protein [Sphingomonas piscis]|uniref:DUF4230 domain-containing protein n=2 Tax=Sphingomonas piscis TaxID=2714943 RepID=A0A6G7YT35_9SPHN|nr:DUF4230 domain-containing protein [Sphingomonas piscis]